ncbi:MAG: hypothetical protein ACTSYI_14135 [Promethearchaeota archaeon]
MTNPNSQQLGYKLELKFDDSLRISEELFNRIQDCGRIRKNFDLFATAFKRFPREAEELQFPGTYSNVSINESKWFQLIDDILDGNIESIKWVEDFKNIMRNE